jgi:hypothetical protein
MSSLQIWVGGLYVQGQPQRLHCFDLKARESAALSLYRTA